MRAFVVDEGRFLEVKGDPHCFRRRATRLRPSLPGLSLGRRVLYPCNRSALLMLNILFVDS